MNIKNYTEWWNSADISFYNQSFLCNQEISIIIKRLWTLILHLLNIFYVLSTESKGSFNPLVYFRRVGIIFSLSLQMRKQGKYVSER